jgi:hypothetical protein
VVSRRIQELHNNNLGKVSDKWSSYLSYYDELFEKLERLPVSLLEIGVQNGGSLETWAKYFQNAKHIIGCDINERCRLLSFDSNNIKVVIGDANLKETYNKILSINDRFDIVIDDGSHRSIDILNSFLLYFALLEPGGIYIVEDTHTLYSNDFGGGVLNEASAYNFFKKMVDVINFQFWQDELSIEVFLRTFFDLNKVPKFIIEGCVESIEFRNSIIVIKKSCQSGHGKLGERITTGQERLVAKLQLTKSNI